VDPRACERIIEVDLLGRHRLALDDVLRAPGLREFDDIVARLRGILGEEHLASARFELGGQLDQQFVEMRNRVGLDSMRRVALVVVRRELGFDLREVIEMPRAGALELAPQLMVADGGAARLEEIAGFRKFSHRDVARQFISATWRIRRSTASRAESAAGCSGACDRKLWKSSSAGLKHSRRSNSPPRSTSSSSARGSSRMMRSSVASARGQSDAPI